MKLIAKAKQSSNKIKISTETYQKLGPGHKVRQIENFVLVALQCLPILWPFCNPIPLAFKVEFPGGAQSLCLILRLGDLVWALELSQQCENFFGIIDLQFVGYPLGSSIVWLMATSSKRTYSTCHTSWDFRCQRPSPRNRSLLTCASSGDTQMFTGRSGSVFCGGHCSFSSVLWHTRFCLHPLRVSGRYEV